MTGAFELGLGIGQPAINLDPKVLTSIKPVSN